MKKYEVLVDDENADLLKDVLQALPYVKDVKQAEIIDAYSVVSQSSLAEDWLTGEDDELQRMYKL